MRQQRKMRQRLRTLETLQNAVAATRSLSAHHFRLARQALPAARGYRELVEQAVGQIQLGPSASAVGPTGVFLVAADLGLCGDYNSGLARAAGEVYRRLGAGPLYCVGRRGERALRAQGLEPTRTYPAAASVEGLRHLLLEAAEDLMDDHARGRLARLQLVSARFEGAGRFSPRIARLLPVAAPRAERPVRPSPYVSPRHLAGIAVREFLYILLYESLLDALAAEHGMRLVAAQSAEDWLVKAVGRVRRQLAANQREIATQELLDLVSGIRAERVRRLEQQDPPAGHEA